MMFIIPCSCRIVNIDADADAIVTIIENTQINETLHLLQITLLDVDIEYIEKRNRLLLVGLSEVVKTTFTR